jgi:inner membrane protein
MDTLTHALSGALLARATTGIEKPALPLGRRIGIGFMVAAFPDIDVVATWISPLAYLYHHRGVTHSLLMLPLWHVAPYPAVGSGSSSSHLSRCMTSA